MKEGEPGGHKCQWTFIRPLLLEKAPLFILAAISSVVTFIFQQKGGGVIPFEGNPLGARLANAFVSYIVYIEKTIWPNNLAVFYPSQPWASWQVLGAVLFFITMTLITIQATQRSVLTVGWLWYVGTLVPVIGLIQVGDQARADRYTYIPLIGLFIMAAWGIPELSKKWRYRGKVLAALSVSILSCFLIVTSTQVGYWQNNFTLSNHALRVTDYNYVAYNNRGNGYANLNNEKQAVADYDRAIEINPKFAAAYVNRGGSYFKLGNYKQAIEDLDRAIEINPRDADAYSNRGAAYAMLGNRRQAIWDYDRAIEINPEFAEAYTNRGVSYAALGNYKQAIVEHDRAIEINPKFAEAYFNRAASYNSLGNQKQTYEDLKAAAKFGSQDAKNFLKSQGISW